MGVGGVVCLGKKGGEKIKEGGGGGGKRKWTYSELALRAPRPTSLSESTAVGCISKTAMRCTTPDEPPKSAGRFASKQTPQFNPEQPLPNPGRDRLHRLYLRLPPQYEKMRRSRTRQVEQERWKFRKIGLGGLVEYLMVSRLWV